MHEVQQRLVLLLNHVLMQEPEAQAARTPEGRVVQANWRVFCDRLAATPAGLLEVAPPDAGSDLTLVLTQDSPWELAQAVLRGDKPAVHIEGTCSSQRKSTGWSTMFAGMSRKASHA